MIQFHCPVCGKNLRVPGKLAGKQGRCPGCRERLTVPEMSEEAVALTPLPELRLREEHFEPTPAPSIVDDSIGDILTSGEENRGRRKYPAILDILLYPASSAGLINLLIFWLVPTIIGLVASLPFPLWGLIGLILIVGMVAFLFSYLANCVRDSAEGGTRAPDSVADMPSIGEAFSQFAYVLAPLILFVLPPVILYYWRGPDPLFWTVSIVGALFLPIAMLSTIVLNSVSILLPWLWLSSILSTLIPYLGLLVLLYVINVPRFFIPDNQAIGFLLMPFQIYGLMISAHLLGRFFFRYEERLNWEA